jgi:hypothetical protein
LCEAVRRDIRVAVPFSEQSGWDALICLGWQWRTVQVKTAYQRNGSYSVDTLKGGGYGNTRTTESRKYKAGDFDLLAAVDTNHGKVWILTAEQVIGRRCIKLQESWIEWNT